MALSGEQIGQLRDAIVLAFDKGELVDLVTVKLDENLENIVDLKEPLPTVALKLIQHCDRHGKISSLESAIFAARKTNQTVVEYCRRYASALLDQPSDQPLDQPSDQPSTDRVSKGIEAVAMQPPGAPVLEIVAGFREDLETIRGDIELLKKYKTLHDLLHQIDFGLLDLASKAATAFRQDEKERWSLLDYAGQLADFADTADKTVQGLPSPRLEMRWIDNLRSAAEALRMAADPGALRSQPAVTEPAASATEDKSGSDGDGQAEQRAIEKLGSIVAAQPSRINSKLIERARHLLGPLLQLTRILGKATAVLGPGASARSVADGVVELGRRRADLDRLIEEHDLWQSVDIPMRIAAASPDGLMDHWPDLRQTAKEVCGISSDEAWAQRLLETVKRFDAAAAASAPDQTVERRLAFTNFRSIARRRFFNVDNDLRTLCGELVNLAEPLRTLLEAIS